MVLLHFFLYGKASSKRYVFVKQFYNKHIKKPDYFYLQLSESKEVYFAISKFHDLG